MYQYVNATISGITGICDIVKSSIYKFNKTQEGRTFVRSKSYTSVIILGLGIAISLLLGVVSIELILNSLPQSAALCVATLSGIAAFFIAGILIKHEIICKVSQAIHEDNLVLIKEKSVLEQKVNDLITHSDIASAATSSKSFGCFMGSVARLLRKDNTLRELTIFSKKDSLVVPHTYYQLSDFSELCLSFSGLNTDTFIHTEAINSELLGAKDLVLEYIDGNITIDGRLIYDAVVVGMLRVTIFKCTEKSHTFKELVEGIVQNALSSVNIELDNIEEALHYKNPELSNHSSGMQSLMIQLAEGDTVLGVAKLGLTEKSIEAIELQKSLLLTVSGHISKALYNQNLYQLAIKDGLTDLYNKRYLLEELRKDYTNVLMGDEKLSFTLIDIDHFKKVNDTWGHPVGDEVLKRVAQIVYETARESDVVCRYGGEELAILMPNTTISGAEALAERIRLSIEEEVFVVSGDKKFGVTASFGVAGFGSGMLSTRELIDDADKALYIAKNNGRNKVVVSNQFTVMQGAA